MSLQFVAGELEEPRDVLSGWLYDPNTGEPRERQRASDEDSVARAVEAAAALHLSGDWRAASWSERAHVLGTFTRALSQRAEQLALVDAEQTGVPIRTTRELVAGAVGLPQELASVAESLLHELLPGRVEQHWLPLGPAAVVTPWNAPTAIALGKVSMALAAGAPVILKPSEWSPGSASVLAEAAREAQLPAGLFQVVHGAGQVGARLARDQRIAAVSLTGSPQAGLAVAQAAAERLIPADLELSGNNPLLALPGSDPHLVARALVHGMTFLNGQWCSAPRRAVVPADMLDSVRDDVLEALQALQIGASTDQGSDLGPLISQKQRTRLTRQVNDLELVGAKVHTRGELPPSEGFHFRPVVLTDGPRRGQEELFGPVLQLLTYETVEQGLHVANDHPYGLAAYVFGPDPHQASTIGTRLRAGLVRVNAVQAGLPSPQATCGMWARSGHGNVGLSTSLRFFTGARCVG